MPQLAGTRGVIRENFKQGCMCCFLPCCPGCNFPPLLPRTGCCRAQEPSGAGREAEAWELLRSLRVTSGEPTVERKSTFQVGACTWHVWRGLSRSSQLAATRPAFSQ